MLKNITEYNIVDLSLGGPAWLRGNQPDTGISTLVMDSKKREFNAEINIQDLRTTIGALADLDGDELIESAVDLGVQNPTLTTRYPESALNLQAAEALGRLKG